MKPSGSRTTTAQNSKWLKIADNARSEVKNLNPAIETLQSVQMETVVEPNEEVQLDFAGHLTDELNKAAYFLVAVEKRSKFPTAKVVSNTTADIAFKFMQ